MSAQQLQIPEPDPRTNQTTEFFKHLIDLKLRRPDDLVAVEASYITIGKEGNVETTPGPTRTIGLYAFDPEQLKVHLMDWSDEEGFLLYCAIEKLCSDLGIAKSGTFFL